MFRLLRLLRLLARRVRRNGRHRSRHRAQARGSTAGERQSREVTGDDFAEEHKRPTFADDQRGGPERRPEPESPRGHSGMDGR